jgi:GR25 family glycosyltransferase involved in LPS biosynthesis
VKNSEFKIDTYVINMDGAPHRMAHMKNELDRLGIPFIRQVGIVGSELQRPHPNFLIGHTSIYTAGYGRQESWVVI